MKSPRSWLNRSRVRRHRWGFAPGAAEASIAAARGVEKLIAAGFRSPGQRVLEEALERGGAVKFFFGRTGQFIVQRFQQPLQFRAHERRSSRIPRGLPRTLARARVRAGLSSPGGSSQQAPRWFGPGSRGPVSPGQASGPLPPIRPKGAYAPPAVRVWTRQPNAGLPNQSDDGTRRTSLPLGL